MRLNKRSTAYSKQFRTHFRRARLYLSFFLEMDARFARFKLLSAISLVINHRRDAALFLLFFFCYRDNDECNLTSKGRFIGQFHRVWKLYPYHFTKIIIIPTGGPETHSVIN